MKLSYVIGVHNEDSSYIVPLMDTLLAHKEAEDEIIIVDDFSDNISTKVALDKYRDKVTIVQHKFDKDFAAHKNYMNSLCTGEFIMNIDCDELPSSHLLSTIKEIIICNPSIELYYVPRVNIVKGMTDEDVKKYGWQVNDKQFVNFPDWQGRVYRNASHIKWEGKVHEKIVGTSYHSYLPHKDAEGNIVTEYCLLHMKDISRQRQQNELYSNL